MPDCLFKMRLIDFFFFLFKYSRKSGAFFCIKRIFFLFAYRVSFFIFPTDKLISFFRICFDCNLASLFHSISLGNSSLSFCLRYDFHNFFSH